MAKAERLAGVPDDTIVKMKNGVGTDYENYVAVMKLLRYSAPLYGKLISGRGVEILETSTVEEIRVPLPEGVEYSPDLLAIMVDDDRYEPRYFRDTFLYFKKTDNNIPKSLIAKHPYVVKPYGMAADVMIIRPGSKGGYYNLLALDGSSNIIQDAQLEWCSSIEGAKWEY